jgi:short-subunit dehydrogenase
MKQEAKKTAIITGSRGIGKEAAIILAKKSVNVVICPRTQSEINSTVEEINKQTGNSNVLGIKCDVSIFRDQFSCQIDNRKIWKQYYRHTCK